MREINTIEDFKQKYNKLFYRYNNSKYITAHKIDNGVCIIAWKFKPTYVYATKTWQRKVTTLLTLSPSSVGQIINHNISKWSPEFEYDKAIIENTELIKEVDEVRSDLKNLEFLPF